MAVQRHNSIVNIPIYYSIYKQFTTGLLVKLMQYIKFVIRKISKINDADTGYGRLKTPKNASVFVCVLADFCG